MFNSAGSYEVGGTMGQSDAGLLGGSTVKVAGGFWSFQYIPSTDLPPSVDLALAMSSSPDLVSLGNNLTYTITVTNKGPARRPT